MSGPTRVAAELETRIAELETQRDNAETRKGQQGFNRLLYRNRELLRWCKTRVPKSIDTRAAVIAASQGNVIFCCVDTLDARYMVDLIASAFLLPLIDVAW